MKFKHIFGPVSSRRLGKSLGIDLVPFKYCPLNCVYCEVQKTTHLVTEREEFFPAKEVLAEFEEAIRLYPDVNYITFSGAGEPTLNLIIGEVVSYIKAKYPQYQLALLTNGVLLHDETLWKEINNCDAVLPSLDAGSQAVYELINRPKPGLQLSELVDGIVSFRGQFTGKIWLEVFIIPGLNDTDQELGLIAASINRIKPDKIQINSLDRAGAEDWVTKPSYAALIKVKEYFESRCSFETEIISRVTDRPIDMDEALVAAIRKVIAAEARSAEELSAILEVHINEIIRTMRYLLTQEMVSTYSSKGEVLYKWKS